MTVALFISIISLVLSVSAVSLSLYTRWGKSRVTVPPLLSTKSKEPEEKIKEPEEAELESGMDEWPRWSWQEHYDTLRRVVPDGSIPGDPRFNVTVKSG